MQGAQNPVRGADVVAKHGDMQRDHRGLWLKSQSSYNAAGVGSCEPGDRPHRSCHSDDRAIDDASKLRARRQAAKFLGWSVTEG
ncbi:MAG: hypothetical protein R3C56_41475, partial [Pirellulaceae bacterium]